MIKRTLYFGNPAYLKTKDAQLVHDPGNEAEIKIVPIEDIGIVILDHQQITISQALIAKLLANNAALITCNDTHHPTGLLLNLDGNELQSQRFRDQVEASAPLKKQLWQQTIQQKILNQSLLLQVNKVETGNMQRWIADVKSGDSTNLEARAAVYFWSKLFFLFPEFKRDRFGEPPNNLLNYGYSILRAIVARSLVGSGLLPTLGIHHRNQYNAYCLADDIMEPYRPYVDELVLKFVNDNGPKFLDTLTTAMKREMLALPTVDVMIEGERSPLMIGVQKTTASLAKCFEGKIRRILYPEFKPNFIFSL